jgi:hypothetical protein
MIGRTTVAVLGRLEEVPAEATRKLITLAEVALYARD